MATNLRLRPEAEAAVRAAAARTGRSQQELIREAVDRYLDIQGAPGDRAQPRSDADALVARGAVLPARCAFRLVDEPIVLTSGVSTIGLLDRDDRG